MASPWRLYTDGGARGNPGPAGIGVVLEDAEGKVVATASKGLGRRTNNEAEYEALVEGLRLAKQKGAPALTVYLDSLLVAQQMKGAFKVRNARLKPLHARARRLVREFQEVVFEAVPRERNEDADRLANEAMDAWVEEHP